MRDVMQEFDGVIVTATTISSGYITRGDTDVAFGNPGRGTIVYGGIYTVNFDGWED